MAPRKSVVMSNKPHRNQGVKLKDEVYRQMFLLEDCRPGAEMSLALALLRAWLATDSKPTSDEERDWLRKVSPICMEMIEVALQSAGTAHPCVQ